MTRRVFDMLILAVTPFAYLGAIGWGALRFFTPLPGSGRKSRKTVGDVEEFEGGLVKRVEFNDRSFYVLEKNGEFTALDANCPHLNCSVNWVPSDQVFDCPCHGGQFHRDGSVARKPPEKPLDEWKCAAVRGKVVLFDEKLGENA